MNLYSSFKIVAAVSGALLASSICTFETAAELKFFAGVGIFFRLHKLLINTPDTYVTMPCSEFSADTMDTSLRPNLFKGCIGKQFNQSADMFNPFPSSTQNLFGSCPNEDKIREFTFTSVTGAQQPIKEKVPCNPSTLAEKVVKHNSHNVTRDGPYFDVHVYNIANEGDREKLDMTLQDWKLVPRDYSVSGGICKATVLAHYFNAGTTAVDYFHSHTDRFLSFGMYDTAKVWELINPYYHDLFEYEWSGNAFVLTKEIFKAPITMVKQEPGDILFIPPWWIHKTSQRTDTGSNVLKSFNFNIHYMNRRSVLGLASYVFMNKLGLSSWFYGEGGISDIVPK